MLSKYQECDATNCEEIATEQIGISAGKFGTITLLLCKNCVVKFQDEGAGLPAQPKTSTTTTAKVHDCVG
jgi:hypothetical protein